ncbi:MAG: saccharopine dehydrogenase NADP-binding domain-containing protein [Candidatus Thermoplasmatota archaeon]|nr:saccharopine dehydrogenase NADP-binding domain-containing protein [Candidatus Thermoplasmatota archaeon]
MKVLVIGASGQMGAMTIEDLVEFYSAEVVAADRRLDRVKQVVSALGHDKVTAIELDATDSKALKEAAKDVDVVVNSAWYELNIKIMPVAIDVGANYTDLGGFYDHTFEQLKHDKEAKDAGVTCVLGIGSSPGITNVCGAAGARKLDSVDTISIYCTWGTKEHTDAAAFPAYSVRTVLDELTQNPPIVEGGKHKRMPVLSGETEVLMPEPAGKVVAYYIKHSEPATMAEFVGKGTKNVSFRIGFPANDFATFKTLAQLGFSSEQKIDVGGGKISPKDFITAMYLDAVASSRQSADVIDEYDYFRIDVSGKKNGMPSTVTYFVRTWNDRETGVSSGRDTAVPPSITASWLASGKIKNKGTLPPEACIEPEPFFKELGRRKILVEEELQSGTKYY